MKTLKNAFDTSFEVVQSLTGGAISSYKDLSDFLGIKQPSVSGAKKRGKFPTEWANKLAGHYGFNPIQVFAAETEDAAIDMAGEPVKNMNNKLDSSLELKAVVTNSETEDDHMLQRELLFAQRKIISLMEENALV